MTCGRWKFWFEVGVWSVMSDGKSQAQNGHEKFIARLSHGKSYRSSESIAKVLLRQLFVN